MKSRNISTVSPSLGYCQKFTLLIALLFSVVSCAPSNPHIAKIDKMGWIAPKVEFEILTNESFSLAKRIYDTRMASVPTDLDPTKILTLIDLYIDLCEVIGDATKPTFQFAARRCLDEINLYVRRGGVRTPSFKAKVGIVKLMHSRPKDAVRYFTDAITLDRTLEKEYKNYITLAKYLKKHNVTSNPWVLKSDCKKDNYGYYYINTEDTKMKTFDTPKIVNKICTNSSALNDGLRVGDTIIGQDYRISPKKDSYLKNIVISRKGETLEFGPTYERRTYLGVYLSPSINSEGVVVDGIQKGHIAEKIGIMLGDVIVAVDREKVQDRKSFIRQIDKQKIGNDGVITIIRNNKKIDIALTY